MDGKLNCSMTAENAAFTKIRHLDSRVTDAETRLDVLEQETTQLDEALQEALTNLGEKVETEYVDTASLSADAVGAINITADEVHTLDMTATDISAETINVDNLENVNVLHGKTVDVEKTIATIGQFTETQTTEANNTTTNTTELNVDGETNLTGQVNIDGNVTFTKDNGLSKLQGNYLEIDAAKVVIDNKNNDEYALYVPGVNGDALFGGSVAVQDTLAAKNLIVAETTVINNAQLSENTVLTNPTLADIKQTQELTDKALDIDENGKIVRKFVAGGSAGTVANALIANETRYISELNPIIQRHTDENIPYVFQVDTNTFLPMVNDDETGNVLAVIPNGDAGDVFTTCSHLDNIYYIKGSEYLKYNTTTGTTTVVAQVDESKNYRTMSILGGKVLNEDIPAYWCYEDNKMYSLLDGSELEVSFTVGPQDEVMTVYADKNGKTYIGIVSTDTSFNSILDEGQGILFEVPGDKDDEGKGYAVDCPAAYLNDATDKAGPFNGGQTIEVEESSLFLYRLVKDDVYINSVLGAVRTYNKGDSQPVTHPATVYNYGHFAGFEYITNTPHQVEKVKIDRTQADFTDVPVTADTITINDKATIAVLNATSITAETINVNTGQFLETQTTTANNSVTNTSELNVDGETNLTGQVNIDGDMTFTKDNGLSKLQGNYLEIDAANVVIDNKNDAEYALYVPGVNGNALFGGSVSVQDALEVKNIVVTETAVINNAQLNSNSVLENPTFEDITETQELTGKALDIDENGKIVRKHVGGSVFDGVSFYDGKFYDKVVTTTRELLDYILDTTNKDVTKEYSILFIGNKIHFDASILPEEAIQASEVIGTYKVYHNTGDNTKELSFLDQNYEPYGKFEPLFYFKELLDKVHFYGFKTSLDVISNEGLASEYSKCLHINNCYFNYKDNYYTNEIAFSLVLKNCNNVEVGSRVKWNSTAILNLEQCNDIYFTSFGMGSPAATNVEILMARSNNCCVEVPSAVVGNVTFKQQGPGNNLVVHYVKTSDGTKIDPTYTMYL